MEVELAYKEDLEKQLHESFDQKTEETRKAILRGIYRILSRYDQKTTEIYQLLSDTMSLIKKEVTPLMEHLDVVGIEEMEEEKKLDHLNKAVKICEKLLQYSNSHLAVMDQKEAFDSEVNLPSYLNAWSQMINEFKNYALAEREQVLGKLREIENKYNDITIQLKLKEHFIAVKTILYSLVEIEGIALAELVSEKNNKTVESAQRVDKEEILPPTSRRVIMKGIKKIKKELEVNLNSWLIETDKRIVFVLPLKDEYHLLLIGEEGTSYHSLKITLENTKRMKELLEELIPAEEEDLVERIKNLEKKYSLREYKIAVRTILSSIMEIEGLNLVEILNHNGDVMEASKKLGKNYFITRSFRRYLIEGLTLLNEKVEEAYENNRIISWVLEFPNTLMAIIPLKEQKYLFLIGEEEANLGTLKLTLSKLKNSILEII